MDSFEYPTTAATIAPCITLLPRQMDMSLSDSMSAETMTMIEGSQTVVEIVTMDSTGGLWTQTLSTVTPSSMSGMPSGSHHRNIGAIVGGTVGGVAAVALLVIALLLWRRRDKGNGEMIEVVPSETKPSLDFMHLSTDTPNTIPTPFGANNWQDIYQATHTGIEPTSVTSTESTEQPGLSSKQAAARQQRQKELELQMRHLQEEMMALGPGPSVSLHSDRAEDARQMEMMREQIAMLQEQQQSSWAQGLTDEPPPGYTS